MGFAITISNNTTVTPLYANGAPMANVASGTIHLANTSSAITLTMPTKVARRLDDLDDVTADSVSNGHTIKDMSANATCITSSRSNRDGRTI